MEPALWALVVGASSVTPFPVGAASVDPGFPPFDAVAHLLGYGVLAALLVRAEVQPTRAVVLAFGFGLGVEGVQALVPTRTPSGVDALVNLLGAVAGVLAYRTWRDR